VFIMSSDLNDSGSGGSGSNRVHEAYNNDPLYLQSSDFPGMQLVNAKLNGANF